MGQRAVEQEAVVRGVRRARSAAEEVETGAEMAVVVVVLEEGVRVAEATEAEMTVAAAAAALELLCEAGGAVVPLLLHRHC